MTTYRTTAVLSMRLVRDRSVKYPVESVGDDSHAKALAKVLIGHNPTESLVVICLGPRGAVLSTTIVSSGGTCGTTCTPADVFRLALLCGASSVILAHNHPSGDPTPSADDVSTTRKLVEAGRILGVPVVDHIVVTDDRCESMLALGLGGLH